MKPDELRAALASAAPGGTVTFDSGELEGPFTIDRPLRLVGGGAASVLWAPGGPVLTVREAGVHLADISIEVTRDSDGIALRLEGAARSMPPSFERVRLDGAIEGLVAGQIPRPPSVINLGELPTDRAVDQVITLDVPGPIAVRTALAGLTVTASPLGLHQSMLHLSLKQGVLMPGSLLEARLELEAGGLIVGVRVCGRARGGPDVGEPAESARSPVARLAAASRLLSSRRGLGSSVGLVSEPSMPSARQSVPAPPPAAPPSTAPVPAAASARPPASPDLTTSDVARLVAEARACQASDPDQAVTILTDLIRQVPKSIEARVQLATLQGQQRRFDESREQWEAILALDPAHPHAPSELARCLNRLERFDDAVAVLERALRAPPHQASPEIFRTLALAYHALGRDDEAFWALDKSQSLAPSPALAALRQAWVAHQAQHSGGAS